MGDVLPRTFDAQPARAPVDVRPSVSVLIVDDEADTRDLLRTILEHMGYAVATASNGREALTLLHSIRPQLILLDIQMPVMDGFVFRQEQRRDFELIRIPTAVMTGSNEEPTLDVGVVATLAKPFRRNQLLSVVARYCDPPDASDGDGA